MTNTAAIDGHTTSVFTFHQAKYTKDLKDNLEVFVILLRVRGKTCRDYLIFSFCPGRIFVVALMPLARHRRATVV